MTQADFPFRSFTLRAEGYDRGEVDGYVGELQAEIIELRRKVQSEAADGDVRLHDPEGAVARTLAVAQETADRVLHDANVDADRRRAEADEVAAETLADAEARAAKLLADVESQAAEIRAQGVTAARSAIQVERDKAVAELGEIRRVRDRIRSEAGELKGVLDRYSTQAREASELLGSAANVNLATEALPEFVADDVALAGIVDEMVVDVDPAPLFTDGDAGSDGDDSEDRFVAELAAVDGDLDDDDLGDLGDLDGFDRGETTVGAADLVDDIDEPVVVWADDLDDDALDPDADFDDATDQAQDELADVISIGADSPEGSDGHLSIVGDDADSNGDMFGEQTAEGGTFLAEVQAAADDEDGIALAPERLIDIDDDEDRFLSELRGIADDD